MLQRYLMLVAIAVEVMVTVPVVLVWEEGTIAVDVVVTVEVTVGMCRKLEQKGVAEEHA